MEAIPDGPHYEVHSSELAKWLEAQGVDRYWNVDNDPLLTGIVSFPCPGDELADELRRLDRPLLVVAKPDDAGAMGRRVGAAELDRAVAWFSEEFRTAGPRPGEADDRLFYLCRKGSPDEWLLIEDLRTTEAVRAKEASKAS